MTTGSASWGGRARRAAIATLAASYAVAGAGAAAAMSVPGPDGAPREFAIRRSDGDDVGEVVFLNDDGFDPATATGENGDATTTAFGATRTNNLDGDGTNGNDGTWTAATRTNNLDGDGTRGNDGTAAGDGGTRTNNLDGDGTAGNDGTWTVATATNNRDGDDTRGNDGTSDGDHTRGEDGTGGGDNTATGAPGTSIDD